MASEWTRYQVSQLISQNQLVIGDGYRAKNEELSSEGLPFARVSNVNEGFHFANADRFPKASLSRVGNKISEPGDVVFTSKGSVGRFAFVHPNTPRFVYSPQLCFWRSLDWNTIDPRFLYYWMSSSEFYLQYRSVAGQTDMAEFVSLSDQRRMHLTLPPLSEQRAIAHILGTLDDKIELNRRMNSTLEEMARALFKSWFVDFDPVRAKMEGRDPGLPPSIAALFPDSFEDSELGEIPQGWRVGSILECADLLSGGTPSTSIPGYWDGDIPWVSAKDVSAAGRLFVLDTERTITEAGVKNSSTKLLPKNTTVITARGTVGSYCLLGREMAMNQTNYGLKAKAGVGDYFVYFALASLVGLLQQQSYGTIFDTVTTKTFQGTSIVHPTPSVILRFEQLVTPLMDRILLNLQQARTLAALRDALLPRLISGELRVPDAERFIAEST
jgi:type I restriction enzyme, S subunit